MEVKEGVTPEIGELPELRRLIVIVDLFIPLATTGPLPLMLE